MADQNLPEDPNMERILEDFGRSACDPQSGPLFEPPADRSAMHATIEAIDAETDEASPGGDSMLRHSFRLRWIALAAALLVCAVLFWRDRDGKPEHSLELAAVPSLRDERLSRYDELVRGEAQQTFGVGEDVHIHVTADREGRAYLALLDVSGELEALSAEAISLIAGPQYLGAVEPDGGPGEMAVVIVIRKETLRDEELAEILATAERAGMKAGTVRDERLVAILESIRSRSGCRATGLSFCQE